MTEPRFFERPCYLCGKPSDGRSRESGVPACAPCARKNGLDLDRGRWIKRFDHAGEHWAIAATTMDAL